METAYSVRQLLAASRQGAWAGDLPAVSCARATQGFATELTGAFEAIPVVTGGELIISRLVFTRFVLISAHAKNIDANRHMMTKINAAGLWRRPPGAFS
jgi:hypothetical protein